MQEEETGKEGKKGLRLGRLEVGGGQGLRGSQERWKGRQLE